MLIAAARAELCSLMQQILGSSELLGISRILTQNTLNAKELGRSKRKEKDSPISKSLCFSGAMR